MANFNSYYNTNIDISQEEIIEVLQKLLIYKHELFAKCNQFKKYQIDIGRIDEN